MCDSGEWSSMSLPVAGHAVETCAELLMGQCLSILIQCGLTLSRQNHLLLQRLRTFGIGCPVAAPFAKTGPTHLFAKFASAVLLNPKTVVLAVHCHGHALGDFAQIAKNTRRRWTCAWLP